MNRYLTLICAFFVTVTATAYAEMMPPYTLVDGHTAGVLPRGHFDLKFDVYASRAPGSGLITSARFGVSNRFNLGLSYGGDGLIGYRDYVEWNGMPGVFLKYRLFEETHALPAFAVGFDNQGYGGWTGGIGYDGYMYKAPGFFVAASKNFIMMNTVQVGFHGVVNYSVFERTDGPDWKADWLNFLVGLDIGINEELIFILEYNMATDDFTGSGDLLSRAHYNPFHGFLNLGIRWAFSKNFQIEFNVKDVFENKVYAVPVPIDGELTWQGRPFGWNRGLKVTYITKF